MPEQMSANPPGVTGLIALDLPIPPVGSKLLQIADILRNDAKLVNVEEPRSKGVERTKYAPVAVTSRWF
jgi:hypothetical protein